MRHVFGARLGDESEHVTDFVHRLGDDALALCRGVKLEEPLDRDDGTESLDCRADDEVAPVVVEVRARHDDVVVRLGLLPRLVVEQLEESGHVKLAEAAPFAGLLDVPVDTLPWKKAFTDFPGIVSPYVVVVNRDAVLDASKPKHGPKTFHDGAHVRGEYPQLMHDVDRTNDCAHVRLLYVEGSVDCIMY